MANRSGSAKRILLLGDATQVHLTRWEEYLRDASYELLTVSLEPVDAVVGPRRRIHIPSILPPFVRYTLAVPEVRRIVQRFGPHLVNAHFLPNYGALTVMTGFRPWVLSTWGSDVMRVPEKSPLHMMRTRQVIARATAITSDAELMTRRLIELGASPDRVVTFPFGVDRKVFYPSDGVSSPGPRIISNRKLEAVYNIETIIAAFPKVVKAEPQATLTVAGDGDLGRKLRASAARVAPVGSITFTGHINHGLLPKLLRSHDIYVAMSLSDTTSVSLLEAMASGLFPIVSDIPANREWIKDGDNGRLVPPRDAPALGDAITDAWRNPELRRAAARQNAHIIEERADWYDNMSVLTDLFERVLEGGL